jgi:ABC-type multidrug transport system ATPase subunit
VDQDIFLFEGSIAENLTMWDGTIPEQQYEAVPEVGAEAVAPGRLRGGIEVTGLNFRYLEGSPLVLEDVSFQADPGRFLALGGPSGSGKSTIMRLLLGFESPDSGSIHYDDHDLATLDLEAVRRQLGVVLQSSRVFPGSVLQNIVGTSALTLDDAWEAAVLAGLDEDIRAMPMGMQTFTVEGGSTLSGGQRQRLLIARAIVRRPRILLFDEATSALDNETQALVSRALEALKATRIVIAHRLSTIMHADRIDVLVAGRIVESGRYEDLMSHPGPFQELAKRQILLPRLSLPLAGPLREGSGRGWAQDRLRLRDLGDPPALGVEHVGLNHDRGPPHVQRSSHRFGEAGAHRPEEVRLGLDGAGGRSLGQVEEGADGAQRVGQRHQRAAVHDSAGRAHLRPPGQTPANLLGSGAGGLDPQQGRQGHGAHQGRGRALFRGPCVFF